MQVTLDWTLLTFKRQLLERFGGQALLRAQKDFLFRVKNIPLASPVTHTHGLWEVPGGALCREKGHSGLASPPGSAQRGLFPRLGRQGGVGAGCQEKPKGMRPSQTPQFSSRPLQCEGGLPQSTQTSRRKPPSLFEQGPHKACPPESSLRPGPPW